jgi:hypothetical protein
MARWEQAQPGLTGVGQELPNEAILFVIAYSHGYLNGLLCRKRNSDVGHWDKLHTVDYDLCVGS